MKKKGLITTGYHIPYNPDLKDRARELRKKMTEAEKKLWYGFLRNFPHTILRQKPLDHFIADFYCAKLKLVIEVDGDSHSGIDAKDYDARRTAILEAHGLNVIRFTNHEVFNNFDQVCETLSALVEEGAG